MSDYDQSLNPNEVPGVASAISAMADMLFNGERTTLALMNIGRSVASLFTAFFEMLWRRDFGSLYLNPMAWIMNWMILSVASYFGLAAHIFKARFDLHGLFGVEIIGPLFYVLSFIHARRIWFFIEHPKLELDSDSDGHSWWFIEKLPKGDKWRRARVIYEPAITLLVGIALYMLRVFNLTALGFFILGAVALAIKAFLTWCMSWYQYRRGLDGEYRSKVLSSMRRGATPPKMVGHLPVPEQIDPSQYTVRGGHFSESLG